MLHTTHLPENERLLTADVGNVNTDNEQPPALAYHQMAANWLKETGELAYEGLNAQTIMQILGLWSAAAFAAAAATENEHTETYNRTAMTAGAFAVFGGTYTILRTEAYRLRLSNRTIRIEQATVPPANEMREELSSTKAEVLVLRANLREKEREISQQKNTIEDLNGKLKIT